MVRTNPRGREYRCPTNSFVARPLSTGYARSIHPHGGIFFRSFAYNFSYHLAPYDYPLALSRYKNTPSGGSFSPFGMDTSVKSVLTCIPNRDEERQTRNQSYSRRVLFLYLLTMYANNGSFLEQEIWQYTRARIIPSGFRLKKKKTIEFPKKLNITLVVWLIVSLIARDNWVWVKYIYMLLRVWKQFYLWRYV